MRKQNQEDIYHDVLRLWIFRLLAPKNLLRKFIQKSGFADNDVAEYLGIEDEFDNATLQVGFRRKSRLRASVCDESESSEKEQRKHRFHCFTCIAEMLESHANHLRLPDPMRSNFQKLARVAGLNEIEAKVLELVVIRKTDSMLGDAFHVIGKLTEQEYKTCLARMLKISKVQMGKVLGVEGRLIGSGLLRWTHCMRDGAELEPSNSDLAEQLVSDAFTVAGALRTMVQKSPAGHLRLTDYSHVRSKLDILRPYLRHALAKRKAGVNFLIYGAPGTGKTELVRSIARSLRVQLYDVSNCDAEGNAAAGRNRLDSLRAAQCLLAQRRALLVFDEAEDVFRGESILQRSVADERKAWMNRMFEQNPVPVFWLSNSVWSVDPAFMRRFDFVIELKLPPQRQRVKLYRSLCERRVKPELIEAMARCEEVTPALVARANEVAREMVAVHGRETAETAFRDLIVENLRAQGVQTLSIERPQRENQRFDPRFFNADLDLPGLAGAMRDHPVCRICLHGPPGTGKTAFGKWLGETLDIPVVSRKASDLLSPYVGMAERKLADAFREAAEEGALLQIDEADTFLQSREYARHSWEVSLVNEMLTQIEHFQGVFVATTNFMRDLDAAAMRRFDFKVKLDYLDAAQMEGLMSFWCRILKLGPLGEEARRVLHALGNGTPGDFANVVRQHRFRKFPDAVTFARAVAEECAAKSPGGNRRLGFADV